VKPVYKRKEHFSKIFFSYLLIFKYTA